MTPRPPSPRSSYERMAGRFFHGWGKVGQHRVTESTVVTRGASLSGHRHDRGSCYCGSFGPLRPDRHRAFPTCRLAVARKGALARPFAIRALRPAPGTTQASGRCSGVVIDGLSPALLPPARPRVAPIGGGSGHGELFPMLAITLHLVKGSALARLSVQSEHLNH